MADCGLRIRVRVSGPTFDTLFMVRVRVRVICGYDVTLNMSTPVTYWRQVVYDKFHPPSQEVLIVIKDKKMIC